MHFLSLKFLYFIASFVMRLPFGGSFISGFRLLGGGAALEPVWGAFAGRRFKRKSTGLSTGSG